MVVEQARFELACAGKTTDLARRIPPAWRAAFTVTNVVALVSLVLEVQLQKPLALSTDFRRITG